MIPAEKIWATRRKLKRGYPQGDLVQELLDEGYPGEEVDAIFNEMVPDNKLSQKDYSFAEVLGWGLVITGVSVLAVF